MGQPNENDPVDLEKAREAWLRLVAVAFKKIDPGTNERVRPRFCIPRRTDDDDAILGRSLAELAKHRAEVERLRLVICTGGAMYRAERTALGGHPHEPWEDERPSRLLKAAHEALQWAARQEPYQSECEKRFPWYRELRDAETEALFGPPEVRS